MSYKQIDEQFDERFVFKESTKKHNQEPVYREILWDWDSDAPLIDADKVKSFLHLIYDQAKAEQREEDIDGVMSLIEGNYDNPNLAGDLEELFGITYQEWSKNE